MTDKEFQTLLKRNLTISAYYKPNWGQPYVEIVLGLIPDKGEEPTILGSVRIHSSDLET